MPISTETSRLRSESSIVIGMRVTIVCATESSRWSTPRSPWSASQTQCTYWTGSGRSSMYLWRIAASSAGSRLSAPSAIAGSPGIARTPTKTSMLASTRTMRAAPTFLRRKPPIVPQPPRLLVGRERDPGQGVGIHRHAGEVVRDARARDGVIQVDQRAILEDEVRRGLVQRLPGLLRRGLPRVVENQVEPRVRVPAVVLRP